MGMVAHALNHSTQDVEAGGSRASLRSAWSTYKYWDVQGYVERPCLVKNKKQQQP